MKMKYILFLGVLSLILGNGSIVSAHVDPNDPTHVDAEVSGEAVISPSVVPAGQRLVPPAINRAATIKANIETRVEQNKEVRNNILEKRVEMRKELASTTKDIRMDARADIKTVRASTTEMFKRTAEMRKEIAKKMEVKAFEARKNALVKELNHSLANLADISARITTRIEKAEAEGRTMTDAKALLVTAAQKIEKAKADVTAFQMLTASSTQASASTTAEVELSKPRVLGDAAIKSVKEARDALQKVVVAIAHNMGLKAGVNASTTREVNQ